MHIAAKTVMTVAGCKRAWAASTRSLGSACCHHTLAGAAASCHHPNHGGLWLVVRAAEVDLDAVGQLQAHYASGWVRCVVDL